MFTVSIILGIVTGISQWLVLRKQVQNSIQWILFSTFGWAVGIIVGSVVGLSLYYMFQQYSLRFNSQLDINPNALILWPVILAGITTGVTAGAITGTVLVRLLQPTTPTDQTESEERIITF
jgi:heme/copper-type cytochrome/quinol oxidase subunit 2